MAIKDIEDSNSILVGTDKGIIDLYRIDYSEESKIKASGSKHL